MIDAQATPDFAQLKPRLCVGFMEPKDPQVKRARSVLDEGRLSDAQRHIQSLPESDHTQLAWKDFLLGELALSQGKVAYAEERLLRSLGHWTACSPQYDRARFCNIDEPQTSACAVPHRQDSHMITQGHKVTSADDDAVLIRDHDRLAALVLESLGRAYRYQDCVDLAYSTHWTAWSIRDRCGSWEDLCETAISLGLDARLGRLEQARDWHELAVDLAGRTSNNPMYHQASARTQLARTLLELNDTTVAVEMARAARKLWQAYDPVAVAVPKAELLLGKMLLRHAQRLMNDGSIKNEGHQEHQPTEIHSTGMAGTETLRLFSTVPDVNEELIKERDSVQVRTYLAESAALMEQSQEALRAFGREYAGDVRGGADQIDLARRILATLAD